MPARRSRSLATSPLRGALQIKCQEPGEKVVVTQGNRPAVGSQDGGVEFLVGEVEPGGALVVEVGEGPLLELLGAFGILGHEPRVADSVGRLSETVGRGRGSLFEVFSRKDFCVVQSLFLGRLGETPYYVPRPGAAFGAGEFEDFGARPLGGIEPGGAEVVELLCRCRNRLPLLLGRLGEGEGFEAGGGSVI